MKPLQEARWANQEWIRLLKTPPDQVMNASIEPLREALRRDAKQHPPGREGWNLLMQYDKFSTRQFLGM